MTVILGQCELLGKRSTDDCPLREEVQEIFKAADQAHRLTSQLLALGRRQVLEPRVIHLQAGIAKIGETLRRLAGPGLDFEIQLDPRPVPVKIDPGQLEQVLQSLVVNARESLHSGGKITIACLKFRIDCDSSNGRRLSSAWTLRRALRFRQWTNHEPGNLGPDL